MSADPHDLPRSKRTARALASLRGLAVGDALGSQFFVPAHRALPRRNELPPGTWQWTDDTEMACSVVAVLAAHGEMEQDALATSFAEHHDFDRGYGPAVNRMLRLIRQEGGDWRELAAALFDGDGSWGNGAAMRVAPLGAWYAGDPERAAAEAERSAHVTHQHREAVAGARAVAASSSLLADVGRSAPLAPTDAINVAGPAGSAGVAGAEAVDPFGVPPRGTALRDTAPRGTASGTDVVTATGAELLDAVRELVPRSAVQAGIRRARDLLDYADVGTVAAVLGCGRRTSAHDTVPFTLWAAARYVDDYQGAVWAAARAGGDVDTTCAIVGGIVASGGPSVAPPQTWIDRTEDLPAWLDDALAGVG